MRTEEEGAASEEEGAASERRAAKGFQKETNCNN